MYQQRYFQAALMKYFQNLKEYLILQNLKNNVHR